MRTLLSLLRDPNCERVAFSDVRGNGTKTFDYKGFELCVAHDAERGYIVGVVSNLDVDIDLTVRHVVNGSNDPLLSLYPRKGRLTMAFTGEGEDVKPVVFMYAIPEKMDAFIIFAFTYNVFDDTFICVIEDVSFLDEVARLNDSSKFFMQGNVKC